MTDRRTAGHDYRKAFGITLALIAILIALCAAMVGSERNQLTRAMLEQTQAHDAFTTASTAMRIASFELEHQHSGVQSNQGSENDPSAASRFIELSHERDLAKQWDDSYPPVITAHFAAAQSVHQAQLLAEISIVIAALALFLASRPAWFASIILSCLSLGLLGYTVIHTSNLALPASEKVETAKKSYEQLRAFHDSSRDEQQAIDRLDPDGSIRARFHSGTSPTQAEPDHASSK
jgi:hypothetical protein